MAAAPTARDVVAWAYRSKDEAVPATILDAIRYQHALGDARTVGRLRGELLALLAFVGVIGCDRSADVRAQVLATLVLGQLPTHPVVLDVLLEAEIARYATQPYSPTVSMASSELGADIRAAHAEALARIEAEEGGAAGKRHILDLEGDAAHDIEQRA